MDRKQIKKFAKQTVSKHYLILTALCFIIVIIGTEFISLPTTDKLYYQTLAEALQNFGTSSFKAISMTVYNLIGADSINSFFTQLYYHILSIFSSANFMVIFSSILGLLAAILVFIFFKRTLSIIIRRIFLEAQTYEKVPVQHVFILNSTKRWFAASIAILRSDIYYFFWCFTIVGAFVKHYSYLLVPYILAENPTITGEQAVLLSRKMMDGHKKEAFLLDLSMIGWDLLNVVTFGIAGIFYVNAYQTAVFTKYYAELRTLEKNTDIPNINLLNDTYLYEKADENTLAPAYKTVKMDTMYINDTKESLHGVRQFFAEWLSIWTGKQKQRKLYQGVNNLEYQLSLDEDALAGKQYPSRLSPLYNKENIHFDGNMNDLRAYSIESLIIFFFLGSVLGWIFKYLDYLVFTNTCVNAGMFHGPWIPMYGIIGILCIILLTKLRRHPIWEYIGCMGITTVVMLIISYALEAQYDMVWWNYSSYFANIDGRVSLQNVILVSFICMFFIHFLLPFIDQWLNKKKTIIVRILCIVLLILLAIDIVYSIGHPNTAGVIKETSTLITTMLL